MVSLRPWSVSILAALIAMGSVASMGPAAVLADPGEDLPVDADPCPGYAFIDPIGWVCPAPGGLYEIVEDGTPTGMFTHGVDDHDDMDTAQDDHIEPGDVTSARDPPVCVQPNQDRYHSILIYARAHDRPDRHAEKIEPLRVAVEQLNALLNIEANGFGYSMEYEFRCDSDGQVTVFNEVLPTDDADATFSTIARDLRNLGYTDGRVKHWVWYDEASGGCRGVGHIFTDSRPGPENWNNGNAGAMFGVTFRCTGSGARLVLMHENGHNIGVVQNSSPNTSGGFHCNDGLDIMCYNDGASRSLYLSIICRDYQHWDCNHDDYFHPDPPAGSYLANNWNLGSGVNRYLTKGPFNPAPHIIAASCAPEPAEIDETVTCTFTATDDASDVAYKIDWGDGSPTVRVPSSGHVPSGTQESASHSYDALGAYTVTITASDDPDAPRSPATSAPTLIIQRVLDPDAPCGEARTDTLQIGIPLVFTEGVNARWERDIPLACGGRDLVLEADDRGHDFDVCFYDEGTRTGCVEGFGDHETTVPVGTTDIRVIYRLGHGGGYTLRVGDAVA